MLLQMCALLKAFTAYIACVRAATMHRALVNQQRGARGVASRALFTSVCLQMSYAMLDGQVLMQISLRAIHFVAPAACVLVITWRTIFFHVTALLFMPVQHPSTADHFTAFLTAAVQRYCHSMHSTLVSVKGGWPAENFKTYVTCHGGFSVFRMLLCPDANSSLFDSAAITVICRQSMLAAKDCDDACVWIILLTVRTLK